MAKGPQRLRLGRRLAMAAEQNSVSDEVADLQAKVLEVISASRTKGHLDREDLRRIALGEGHRQVITQESKPLRLSTAQVDVGVERAHAGRKGFSPVEGIRAKKQKHEVKSDGHALSNSLTTTEQQSDHHCLRDSLYFKSNQDYEAYLIEQWNDLGLFAELFEKLKLLFISRKDFHALAKLCQSLPDMIESPCQVELERAEAFRQFGDLDQAVLALNKAHDKDPQNEVALKSLGFCHKQRGEYDLALHWFNKWTDINPESVEGHYQCALIYSRVKADDLARTHCLKALDLDSAHPLARSLKNKLL